MSQGARRGAALLAAALLAATAPATAADPPAPGPGSRAVRVVGSSSMYAFATTVAETFGRTTRFRTPVVESTGTGGGVKLFCGGLGLWHPDLATASRPITAAEVRGCAEHGVARIAGLRIGYDGVAIAQARREGTLALSRAHLWRALAKTVPVEGQLVPNPYTRWSEIDPGLPDRPILVYGPPPTSGTRDVFAALVMEAACAEARPVRSLPRDQQAAVCRRVREDGRFVEAGEDEDAIARRIAAEPDAVGIVAFNTVAERSRKLEAATVNGIAPDVDTVRSGRYPLSRALHLYVKEAHIGVVPALKPFVQAFVAEAAIGDDGYLTERGLVPLPRPEREAVRKTAAALAPLPLPTPGPGPSGH